MRDSTNTLIRRALSKQKAAWPVISIALAVAVICVSVSVVNEFRNAAALADHSAHAALAEEIFTMLSAVPSGQPYPASLSDLPLSFPDGGDRSLLSRFEYRRTVTGCMVRTKIQNEELVRSFP